MVRFDTKAYDTGCPEKGNGKQTKQELPGLMFETQKSRKTPQHAAFHLLTPSKVDNATYGTK